MKAIAAACLLLLAPACAAPVTLATTASATAAPTGAITLSPAAANFVGLWSREDKPDEGIGFSDTGVWSVYKYATPLATQRYTTDGAVALVGKLRGRRHVYVMSGDEVIFVQGERALRYKRVLIFPTKAVLSAQSRVSPVPTPIAR
ncbi:MAG: hypothetical protein ABR591_10580 [Candidatus Velthaea sp.]